MDSALIPPCTMRRLCRYNNPSDNWRRLVLQQSLVSAAMAPSSALNCTIRSLHNANQSQSCEMHGTMHRNHLPQSHRAGFESDVQHPLSLYSLVVLQHARVTFRCVQRAQLSTIIIHNNDQNIIHHPLARTIIIVTTVTYALKNC